MYREEIDRKIRKTFDDILKDHKPNANELAHQKIEKLARQEKEEYEKKRTEFYNNPLHWDNNKRRRHGLSVLRGRVNKCRTKRYPSFRPTPRLFYILEDVIEEALTNKLNSNEFFDKFVDIKDIQVGDQNVFYVNQN